MNLYERTIKNLRLGVIITKKDIKTKYSGYGKVKKGSKFSVIANQFFGGNNEEGVINIQDIKYEYDNTDKPLLINIFGTYYALTNEKLYQFNPHHRFTTIKGHKMGDLEAVNEVEFKHFSTYFLSSLDRIREISKMFVDKNSKQDNKISS